MGGNGRNKRSRTAENGSFDYGLDVDASNTTMAYVENGDTATSQQQQVEAIQAGTHPEFIKRLKQIEETKTKKISTAQKNRDAQIKNINELYDYEVKDIESNYLKSCEELKQQLISRVYEFDQRSSYEMRSAKKNTKRSKNGAAPLGIEKSLPECDIRHDFVNIVRNMEDTALAFVKAHPNDISVSISHNILSITTGTTRQDFSVGSAVTLTSNVTHEQLHGMITVINEIHVIVKLTSGPRLSIPLHHIKQRRMVFAHDMDTNRDIALIVNSRKLANK